MEKADVFPCWHVRRYATFVLLAWMAPVMFLEPDTKKEWIGWKLVGYPIRKALKGKKIFFENHWRG